VVNVLARREKMSQQQQQQQHLMDNTVDPNCPRCGQAPQMLKHWLDYPGTLQAPVGNFRYH